MAFRFTREMSRLKKKLLLYFILVAIVSISVSAEIILEMSSSRFRDSFESDMTARLEQSLDKKDTAKVKAVLVSDESWKTLYDLRNRMILLLLVISASVIGALFLFTRDIVEPMDGLVDAAKKIAAGDFTATAPVKSSDEIGQLAGLLNDMNISLQDMVVHIKREIDRHREKIENASAKNEQIIQEGGNEKILQTRRISLSQYRSMVELNSDIKILLWRMNNDMSALQAYIGSYKTYPIPSAITQDEIEESLRDFQERSTEKEQDS